MAEAGAFRPLWSPRIMNEAVRALNRIHPNIDTSRFENRFSSMNEAFEDALVEGGSVLENAINLPDDDDRHVVASAVLGRADVIVTNNLRDFPADELARFGLRACSIDDFLLDQFDLNKDATWHVLSAQARATTRPKLTTEQLLQQIANSGAPNFSDAVRREFECTS